MRLPYNVTTLRRALKAALDEHLAGMLARLDEAFEDGVTTPSPGAIYPSERTALMQYPAVEIAVQSSSPQGDSVLQRYQHRLVFVVTVAGVDEDVMTTTVERYVLAIRLLLIDEVIRIPAAAGPVTPGTEDYSMLVRAAHGLSAPFVKGGSIEMYASTLG